MADSDSEEFTKDTNYIDDRVLAEGVDGGGWPVEAGKYRLIGARACPFAHRAIIVRRLMGLDGAISLGLCGPTHDAQSWTFDLYEDSVDPVLGVGKLRDCFLHREPGYSRGITVPALVDIPSRSVVTNDFPTMVTDLATEWAAHHRDGAPDLYPEPLRREIDDITEWMLPTINLGVYKCGLAGSQEAYEREVHVLFDALDQLERRLADRRYLVGEHLTLADVNLFATLVRFDMVYHGIFKCNRYTIASKPNLTGYLRDLFQTPGFGDTVNFGQIKDHYYKVITELNPSGVVPVGPDPAWFYGPHDRTRLGGSPFGEGSAPDAPRGEDVLNGDEPGAFALS